MPSSLTPTTAPPAAAFARFSWAKRSLASAVPAQIAPRPTIPAEILPAVRLLARPELAPFPVASPVTRDRAPSPLSQRFHEARALFPDLSLNVSGLKFRRSAMGLWRTPIITNTLPGATPNVTSLTGVASFSALGHGSSFAWTRCCSHHVLEPTTNTSSFPVKDPQSAARLQLHGGPGRQRKVHALYEVRCCFRHHAHSKSMKSSVFCVH